MSLVSTSKVHFNLEDCFNLFLNKLLKKETKCYQILWLFDIIGVDCSVFHFVLNDWLIFASGQDVMS